MTTDKNALEADCKGSVPQIACQCCTLCCNPDGTDCDGVQPAPTMAPIIPSELTPRLSDLIGVLTPVSGAAVFEDATSPQYRAASWLASNDPAMLNFTSPPFRIVRERYVVTLLYYATNGASWNRGNYLTEDTVCRWGGVFCNPDTLFITGFNLPRNNLDGSLPAELGSLPEVSRITMQTNQLNGNIPTELGELTKMTELDFSNNLLDGNIPSEIGKFTGLINLRLHRNALDGEIPSELGMLSILEDIYFMGNQLTGAIPTEVGGMTSLSSLGFGENKLNGHIPPQVAAISGMRFIGLESNQLSGTIPLGFAILTALRNLQLCKFLLILCRTDLWTWRYSQFFKIPILQTETKILEAPFLPSLEICPCLENLTSLELACPALSPRSLV
jgi:hypothetical protein